MATSAKLRFIDAASPIMEQICCFHDFTILLLVLIITAVGYCLCLLVLSPLTNKASTENQPLEIVWTVLPAVILIFIALPSLKILYLTDERNSPEVTMKVVGHQWYWSYEFPRFNKSFNSYISEPAESKDFRLLDVDNRTLLPIGVSSRILVTASDVIHSWTVQPLGVKIDAVPGRLNQRSIISKIPGLFFGQCSEICGANHRFIPISLEVVSAKTFALWATSLE